MWSTEYILSAPFPHIASQVDKMSRHRSLASPQVASYFKLLLCSNPTFTKGRHAGAISRTISNTSSLRNHAPAPVPSSASSSVLYAKIDKAPLKVVKAEGNYLFCEDGRKIFDATAGASVASLGHKHPSIKPAVLAQMDDVSYCYLPFFTTDAAERISKFLTESTGGAMSRVFIVSSGRRTSSFQPVLGLDI